MKEFFLQYVHEFITGIIAVFVGWFGRSRLSKKQQEADILNKVQGIYDKMVKDTELRMQEMKLELENLKKSQTEINENWKKKMTSIERRWQTKYNNLKKEFETYKQKHP